MKHGKWKEIFSIIASVLIALLLFLLLFLRFHWNLILCAPWKRLARSKLIP